MTDGATGWRELESFRFGDSPDLADRLLDLVVTGRKVATCWSAREGPQTRVGKRMVVRDGADRPRAIVETVELAARRFDEVDAAFAFDEGMLWCERFRVVRLLSG